MSWHHNKTSDGNMANKIIKAKHLLKSHYLQTPKVGQSSLSNREKKMKAAHANKRQNLSFFLGIFILLSPDDMSAIGIRIYIYIKLGIDHVSKWVRFNTKYMILLW